MEDCQSEHEVSFQSADTSPHENSFETANWEVIDENDSQVSNVEPISEERNDKKPKSKKLGLILKCIQGPHEGESFFLDDTVILGQNPPNKKNQGRFELGNDNEASASHTKVSLVKSGSKQKGYVLMVRVTDMKTSQGTLVNGKKLSKGGGRQAFIKDKIQVGVSVFQVQKA